MTVATGRRSRRVAPTRVALVGRLSGATPRVAQAVDDAVAALTPNCRVDCFDVALHSRTRPAIGLRGAPSRDAHRYPARALGQVFDPWGYDALVFVVDRHPPSQLLDLAREHPDVVWFVEDPEDHAGVTELTRRASAVLRSPDVVPLTLDAGPFGRAAPATVVAPDDPSAVGQLLEVIAGPGPSITLPDG